MDFKTKTLDNGLTVVGEINKSAQSAAVGFFVRTGARDETENVSGVSHFLEHMMFKGTDELSALEVNEAFDRTGAQFNAFTSEENTVYYAAVLPEMLNDVTDLWTKLMRPSLRDDDFDMEKNVIKEEIAMYRDMPQFDVLDKCRAVHFKGHPCGNSVLGTEQSIDALKADQMREYFSRRYAADNIVAAFCGNLDFDRMCGLVEKKCGKWQKSNAQRQLSAFDGTGEKNREKKDSLVCEHICMMSPAVSMQDPRRFAMSLLAVLVGDQTGSRYFWSLVDTALAETAVMQCDTMDKAGALYTYIRCSPENSEKVLGIVNEIFKSLNDEGISKAELESAKNKVLSNLTIKCETPMGRLVNLGFNWVYLNEYRSVADDVEAIKSVKVDDVNKLISDFNPANYTRYSVGP